MPAWRHLLLLALSLGTALAQTSVEGRLYIPAAKAARNLAHVDLPSAQVNREALRLRMPLLEPEPLVANARGQVPAGTARRLETAAEGRWDTLPDGRRIWRIEIQSPAAAGLRVHFRDFSAGGGRVWVYGSGSAAHPGEPYTGRGPFDDGDFWSRTVAGDTITVEYGPDTPQNETAPPFSIQEVAHIWSPVEPSAPQVADCHLDFRCYSQWQQIGSGVAHMLFTSDEDGKLYICSGALLNTLSNSFIPYFLTANHCISSDNEARSLETYWFYETAQCNGAPVPRSVATRIEGARLLVTAGLSEGDYTLLRLNSLPNTPVWFSGWNAEEVPLGTLLTGIHHPDGSYKRISFGSRTSDRLVNVGGTLAPPTFYYQVQHSGGRTEGGSSGSPIYTDDGRIVGLLSYGPVSEPGSTVCQVQPFIDGYGRFSVAFPALRSFLQDQAAGVTLTPVSLSFRSVNGVIQAPAEQTVRIETTSTTAVTFSLVTNAAWLRVSPASGSVMAGVPQTITVSVDPAALRTPGSYNGAITVNAGTASQSVQVRVDVAVTQSSIVAAVEPDPVYEQAPDADGYAWFFDVRLRETAGVETRLTEFQVDGVNFSGNITEWFGTDRIPALGSISAGLRVRGLTVPATSTFDFAGVDPGGVSWTRRITARFLGRRTQATLKMTFSPEPVAQDPTSENCPWRHEVVIKEESGIGVNLTRWVAGGHDLSGSIAAFFGSARLDPSSTRRATLCWKGLSVPATLEFEIHGRDDNGIDVGIATRARFVGAPAQAQALRVAPERLTFSAVTGVSEALAALANIDSGTLPWTGRITYSGSERNWLTVFPLSGVGSGALTFTASPAGVAAGQHVAVLIIEAAGVTPVEIPVTLIAGAQAGSRPNFSIQSVVNAASFQRALAPGMLFTIGGTNLAASEAFAPRVPLPYTMGNATVRVNNLLCPLLYVSSGQINAQLPYEIAPGRAVVTVNLEGREFSSEVDISAAGPGVFTVDGQRPTPHSAGKRGEIVLAYLTGVGAVTPRIATGGAPAAGTPVAALPAPQASVEATVGGIRADILFAGIPPGIVGAIQVNYRIPANAPAGNQPVVFTVSGVRANSVVLNVQP
jgi:uncharacterized protein (TIGR03437 family)